LLLDHSIKMRFLDRDNNNTVSKVHSDRFGLDELRIFQLETGLMMSTEETYLKWLVFQ
jgi:hypothetical protein